MTRNSVQAFETLLRLFTRMAYVGAAAMLLGVALGVLLRPHGWGWTAALCVVGGLTLAVGVRERKRGQEMLNRLKSEPADQSKQQWR